MNEEHNATLNDIQIASSDVQEQCPLSVKSISTNGAVTDAGIYSKNYETSTGTAFEYLKPGAKTIGIKRAFRLDNRLYRYYTSGIYFICVKTKLTINGLSNDITPYYGMSDNGNQDYFVSENGHGWWYKQDFTVSAYDARNRTQYIKSNREWNVPNNSPTERFSEFYLEFYFRNFAQLISSRPFTLSLRVDLRYNQI